MSVRQISQHSESRVAEVGEDVVAGGVCQVVTQVLEGALCCDDCLCAVSENCTREGRSVACRDIQRC